MPELFELLAELASADSNLTQSLRTHFGAVEDILWHRDNPLQETWIEHWRAGEILGGAFTERGVGKAGSFATPSHRYQACAVCNVRAVQRACRFRYKRWAFAGSALAQRPHSFIAQSRRLQGACYLSLCDEREGAALHVVARRGLTKKISSAAS